MMKNKKSQDESAERPDPDADYREDDDGYDIPEESEEDEAEDLMTWGIQDERAEQKLWIPADGHTTLTKPYLAGQSEDGKNIWKDEKTTVSNRELKSMVEFYKKDMVPKYDIPEI